MKGMYIFLCNFIFFVFYLSSLMANHTVQNYQEISNDSLQKIYVNPCDLLITERGLFLQGATELISLNRVETDEYGFYVEAKRDPEIRPKREPTCINGHPITHRECGGCANWWCNSRCKCYSPWFKLPCS